VYTIEQLLFLATFNIWIEWNPRHPGNKHMKFRRTSLLCAVVLTVALPICAEGVPYTGATDDADCAANAEFPGEPASAVVLTDSF
jgi:hypothetical protein